ncbi:MAG: hypothetical protein J0L87_05685 [Bacteroidetes bacterium]|nr:hypothetical protein [Bacteroidota bacterium]
MKKTTFYIIAIFAILLSSCEKIPFDKRNKYLGNYRFTYSYYTWNSTPYQSPTITEEYWGKVYYNKKEAKNLIHIEFAPNMDFTFTIDKDGNISVCGSNGKFSDRNTVAFEYSSSTCPGNGLGGGMVYNVKGEKKNK